MSPLGPHDAALRPTGYTQLRPRGRVGVAAIASISPLRPVEASPDAQAYADALSTAGAFAAETRRAAWSTDRGSAAGAFPRSGPAGLSLAALIDDDDVGSGGATSPITTRNVTPGGPLAPSGSTARGIVAAPSGGLFAAAARTYREVASLVA